MSPESFKSYVQSFGRDCLCARTRYEEIVLKSSNGKLIPPQHDMADRCSCLRLIEHLKWRVLGPWNWMLHLGCRLFPKCCCFTAFLKEERKRRGATLGSAEAYRQLSWAACWLCFKQAPSSQSAFRSLSYIPMLIFWQSDSFICLISKFFHPSGSIRNVYHHHHCYCNSPLFPSVPPSICPSFCFSLHLSVTLIPSLIWWSE